MKQEDRMTTDNTTESSPDGPPKGLLDVIVDSNPDRFFLVIFLSTIVLGVLVLGWRVYSESHPAPTDCMCPAQR